MKSSYEAFFITFVLLFSTFFSLVSAEENELIECEILADWGVDYIQTIDVDDNFSSYESLIIHRYVVSFSPPFVNGSSPHIVETTITHSRGNQTIGSNLDSNVILAGGEIDIILPEEPIFMDEIEISIETLEASCNRFVRVTNWNQPIADHEVTSNRTWRNDVTGNSDFSSNLYFEGRGWQQRIGPTLTSNDLGSGSFELYNFDNMDIELDLNKVWLNQTYHEEELVGQQFEMRGQGNLLTIQDGLDISVNVTEAYYNRTLFQDTYEEHLLIDGHGMLEFLDDSENDSVFIVGNISSFYFESFDSDGLRDYQNINLEAEATSFIDFADGNIDLELEEFRYNDLWVYGVQEEHLLKYVGNAEFNALISDEAPYIYTNGTVDKLHFEDRNGFILHDTLRVDGTYDGDVSGSFGIIRFIEDKVTQQNYSGTNFEVNKIRNENWLNVSSVFMIVDEEINAEHNLTYEYTVPQSYWENPVVRYQYIEDNGSFSDEFPDNSPIEVEVERPPSSTFDSSPITKETGLIPEILNPGDEIILSGNLDITLSIIVQENREVNIDGHNVDVIDWIGNYGDNTEANGSVINEGLLAGLFHNINRSITVNMSESEVIFHETQSLDKIRSPSIITADENTLPTIEKIQFREGFLNAEGGQAHLEVTVGDVDNDIISIFVDLSGFDLGVIELSDKGLFGDNVIHDNIWTSVINADGLKFGNKTVEIEIQDYWDTVVFSSNLVILNPAPELSSINFTPKVVKRGDMVEVYVTADDGHGVSSVSVELMSAGGESIQLSLVDSEWVGEFQVPYIIAPGERLVPIRLVDGNDSSRLITKSFSNGVEISSLLIIENEAPKFVNYSIIFDDQKSNKVIVPKSGEPIPQVLEIEMSDPDGLSSVQVKMGRLAPIGESNNWILMKDDGLGVDRIANDGVYSLEIFPRSSLPNGEMEIFVRGTDIYLSTTDVNDQSLVIKLDKTQENDSGNWFSDNKSILILIGLFIVLSLSVTGIIMVLRNSDFD
tara:strand:+ start:11440 stop:14445 length:3006 start_codon:yes stop_codon:yes gene_type:complete